MKKFNKRLRMAIIIVSLLSVMANYFNVLATPAFAVNLVVGCFAAVMAMMQVYHYRSYQDYEPGWFWFLFSAIFGVILVALIYATGCKVINEHLALSLVTGLFTTLLPVLGIFFGDVGRMFLKGEQSAIIA